MFECCKRYEGPVVLSEFGAETLQVHRLMTSNETMTKRFVLGTETVMLS